MPQSSHLIDFADCDVGDAGSSSSSCGASFSPVSFTGGSDTLESEVWGAGSTKASSSFDNIQSIAVWISFPPVLATACSLRLEATY